MILVTQHTQKILKKVLGSAILCLGMSLSANVLPVYGADDKSFLEQNNKEARITVVYPKLDQTIGAIDSTFIFGSVKPEWNLTINGQVVTVDKDGGWLAFLPLESGEFVFNIVATNDKNNNTKNNNSENIDTALVKWPVSVPGLSLENQLDTLVIYPDYRSPVTSRSVITSDIIRLQFRATPNCRAWAEIVGIVDSIPMSEALSIPQPYHAGDVFDSSSGQLDSALFVKGIYQGLYVLKANTVKDSVRLVYHVVAPSLSDAVRIEPNAKARGQEFAALLSATRRLAKLGEGLISDTASISLSFNPQNYPRTVEFTDTAQRLRVAPARGYLGLFQPAGVQALAVGYEGDWYRLQLSESRVGYVEFEKSRPLKVGILPPQSRLSSFRCELANRKLSIRSQLSAKHPFSITEQDNKTLVVELFGVTMDTDWFRFEYRDSMLTSVSWTQPEPNLFRLELRFSNPIWGYQAGYVGNTFELTLNYPPTNVHSLGGKTIVVDPGHNPDPGSIGPTGLTEAEANWKIALVLRSELEKRGAKVVLTHQGVDGLELYGRPKVADSVNADLFVSVHNNALPDGVNPFVNYGVSTYFYHTHSQALAKAIHQKMIDLPNQKDHGFYHGNLAVLRPTERPSALVECGFMILPEQERWLKTESYRHRVAKAIAQGIEQFFKNYGESDD